MPDQVSTRLGKSELNLPDPVLVGFGTRQGIPVPARAMARLVLDHPRLGFGSYNRTYCKNWIQGTTRTVRVWQSEVFAKA